MGAYRETLSFIQEHPAAVGWAAIGAFVAAWDMRAPQTLSEGVDQALERHKAVTMAAIGYTALHLVNALPERMDLFHLAFEGSHRHTVS